MRPYYQDEWATIYHGDCREHAASAGRCWWLTDPPYGLGRGYMIRAGMGAGGGRTETVVGDETVALSAWVWATAPGGVVVVFCDERTLRPNVDVADAFGWSTRMLVWDKVKPSMQQSLRRQYELVLVGTRDGHLFHDDKSFTDVLRCLRSEGSGHPTAKPADLLQRIMGFVQPEPTVPVLDPFMGSGTTLVAAKNLGRKSIGIEIEEKYCEIAAQRLSQGVLALTC